MASDSVTDTDQKPTWLAWLKNNSIDFLKLVGCLCVIGSLLACFASYHWALELACHFRHQYCLLLIICAIVQVMGKNYKLTALFLIIGVLQLPALVSLYLGSEKSFDQFQPEELTAEQTILYANVYTKNTNYSRFIKLVGEQNPDVVAVIECDENWVNALEEITAAYPYHITHPRGDNFGLAFYSKHPIVKQELLDQGRIILPTLLVTCDTPIGEVTYYLIHVLPPGTRKRTATRDEGIRKILEQTPLENGPVVLLGDFNTTSHSYIYDEIVTETGLRDSRAGFGMQPTWPAYIPFMLIPIDHMFVTDSVIVKDRKVLSGIGSDHYPLRLKYVLQK